MSSEKGPMSSEALPIHPSSLQYFPTNLFHILKERGEADQEGIFFQLDASEWSDVVKYFGHRFPRLAGSLDRMEQAVTQYANIGEGRGHAKRLFAI